MIFWDTCVFPDNHLRKGLHVCSFIDKLVIEMDARYTPQLCIVVPSYNEEEALPETARTLFSLLKGMVEAEDVSPESYICFVNDGSTDATWQVVESLMERFRAFRGVERHAQARGSLSPPPSGRPTAS